MVVVGICPDLWDDQWMNRHHLMWAMRKFADVIYVQEPEMWSKGIHCRDERFFRPTLKQVEPNLRVLKLPKILCRRSSKGWWTTQSYRLRSRMIRSFLKDSSEPLVLFLWHPYLLPYVEYLKPDAVVYHLYDLFPAYHSDDPVYRDLRASFRDLCQTADLVLTGTPEQAARIPRADVLVTPNGVPVEWYSGAQVEPEDLAKIPHPRVGYVGSVNDKIDFDWFSKLCDDESLQIVVAGPVGQMQAEDHAKLANLKTRPNFHLLGNKPPSDVPRYISGLDVGLMNYRRGKHCEFASPIKLYEYSAAGLPIVGSPVQALTTDAEGSRFVEFADSPDEAVAKVNVILSGRSKLPPEGERLRFASENSWSRRVERILKELQVKLRQKRDIASPSTDVADVAPVTESVA